jgi:hypothetical protein
MTNIIPPDLRNSLREPKTMILIILIILATAKLIHSAYVKSNEMEEVRLNHFVEKKQGRG